MRVPAGTEIKSFEEEGGRPGYSGKVKPATTAVWREG